MADDLLTMEETSKRTTVPVNSLRYLRHQGTGPKSFRLGRRVLYKASDVEAWIEANYQSERRDHPSAS